MKLQVTKRSECGKTDGKERCEGVLTPTVEVKAEIRWLSRLVNLLMNPTVWRIFIVHIPGIWEKIEAGLKQFFAWFSDLL